MVLACKGNSTEICRSVKLCKTSIVYEFSTELPYRADISQSKIHV